MSKKIAMSKIPAIIPIFGDIDYRGKCSSEIVEQVTFFDQIRQTKHGAVAMSMKNEGKRTQGQYNFDSAAGLLTGAADIHIIGLPPFYCEMKEKRAQSLFGRHFPKNKGPIEFILIFFPKTMEKVLFCPI